MRIANQSIYNAITLRLAKSTEELYKANQVASSGKKINNLSDDPVALVQVLSVRSSISNMDQLNRNITAGRNWLDAGETALESVKELITDAKVLGLQMVNGTMSESERMDAADQVEGILDQVVSLANTTVNGQYIFAGTETDQKPFEIGADASGDPIVVYSGNDDPFTIKIGKDADVQVGHDGETVFGNDASGILRTLIDLKGSLETNDTAGIEQTLTTLDTDYNHVINTVSEIGAKGLRLDTKEKIIGDLKFSYQERKSSLEDADIIEAISNLNAKQTAYEAALASSSKVMRMTLLDYL